MRVKKIKLPINGNLQAFLVTCMGFEPMYVALRGLCVRPLHQQAENRCPKTFTILTLRFIFSNTILHLLVFFQVQLSF